VDDNPINLSILERTLKRHFSHLVSPDIAVASSGNAALSRLSPTVASPREEVPPTITSPPSPTQEISSSPFDLILLDIDMPDISGVQVAEQIRNVHNDQATAIVAVTTSTKPDQQRAYEMAGMDGVVGKPIDLDLLDSVVTKALLARRKGRPRTSSVPPLSKALVAKTLQKEYFERRAKKSDRMASSSPIGSPGADTISRRSSFPLSLEELSLMQESAILSASAEEDHNDDDEIFVNLDEQLTKSLILDDLCKTAIEEEVPYYILQKITDG
jgi:CheY-like chemotaxis protein